MQRYLTLFRRELAGYFVSPTGYIIIAGVQLLLGLSFSLVLEALNGKPTDMPITEKFHQTGLFWVILLLAAPVITMRTFALEKFSGTYETLMTTPVSDVQVVLAKFSGALAFYVVAWSPVVAYPYLLRHYSVDFPPVEASRVGGSFIGLLLLGCFYMAVGCFASSLTRVQLLAAMNAFAIGMALFLVSLLPFILPPSTTWETQLFSHISMIEHMRDFTRGIVDTRHVIFYLSLTTLFLFLTVKVVESRRWK
jgi:ABC-2 type transport system permease protein